MNPENSASTPIRPPLEHEEIQIDLMTSLARLIHGYKIVLTCTASGILLSLLLCVILSKTYTARAVFMPPVNPDAVQATSLILRQDPSDLYLGMLSSRTVEDSVIDSVHLMDVYKAKLRTDARATLSSQSKFTVEKNALIAVSITTVDPKLSADIGNAYLEALYKLNGQMSASSSAHRREFFESQLAIEKEALSQAESQMQQMEEKTGTVLPEGEAQAGVSATARLQASIEDAEARLSSLLTGSTEQNPQVVELRAQIAALRSELLQQQSSSQSGGGLPSAKKMPGVMLDYLRKSRELKERETLYESLTQQYERARLSSLDPGPQLEIVDRAVIPERKSGPPRTLIVVAGTLLGILLGILLVLLAHPLRRYVHRYRQVSAQILAR
jgi:tyrosine-protein kinase Etk/Wzc